MAANKDLAEFVQQALTAGHSRSEIQSVLDQAGWSKTEVSEALGAWSQSDFTLPVPMPQVTLTARDFFFYALMFGALLLGAIYLVLLLHGLIDLFFAEKGRWRVSSMRWSISVLIVAAPLYFWMAYRDQVRANSDPALARSIIRKWMIYISLLLAAGTLLGDLMATIYAFLGGDLTGQFLMKAVAVAVVAGLIFLYYRQEIRVEDGS